MGRYRRWLLALLGLLVASPAAGAVDIDWVAVGDPGNPCIEDPYFDGARPRCLGAVTEVYRIGKYETTNAQYVEFLNAVAATDTHGLYENPGFFIRRSGPPGSFRYSTTPGVANLPVIDVSFYSSLRFANWMHNGQPTGAQDNTTTEDGAYTFTGTTRVGFRNPGAKFFLPTEDEWFKAAYFDGSQYFAYPTGTNAFSGCAHARTITAKPTRACVRMKCCSRAFLYAITMTAKPAHARHTPSICSARCALNQPPLIANDGFFLKWANSTPAGITSAQAAVMR